MTRLVLSAILIQVILFFTPVTSVPAPLPLSDEPFGLSALMTNTSTPGNASFLSTHPGGGARNPATGYIEYAITDTGLTLRLEQDRAQPIPWDAVSNVFVAMVSRIIVTHEIDFDSYLTTDPPGWAFQDPTFPDQASVTVYGYADSRPRLTYRLLIQILWGGFTPMMDQRQAQRTRLFAGRWFVYEHSPQLEIAAGTLRVPAPAVRPTTMTMAAIAAPTAPTS